MPRHRSARFCAPPALRAVALGLLLIGVAGCTRGGVAVTGTGDRDPTFRGTQSETAAATAFVGGRPIMVVAYNDDTDDGRVTYTAADRVVRPGASLLGWSYSTDRGRTWTYGGKVKPPPGIDALWGDPAIVASRTRSDRVYISSLAIAAGRIPRRGHTGPMSDGTISGACVARSDDGGRHFAIQSCISEAGHFYDGGALAAASPADGRLFAAYVDIDTDRIDVWVSRDGVGPFVKLPDPFPGLKMRSHPRLAYDQSRGALLVAAIDDGQFVYLNRLVGDRWQRPVLASYVTSRVEVRVGSQTIRMGPGFSFDVGAPTVIRGPGEQIRFGDDEIRLLYTTRDAETRRMYVRGSACHFDLSGCHDVPQWGTTPGNLHTPRDQWNPTVTAWQGFFGLPPVWKATYQTTDDDPAGVSIKEGNLTVLPNGTPIFLPFALVGPRPICPDVRDGSPGSAKAGYWGDYDEKALAGFPPGSTSPEFLLAFSDSSRGCLSQYRFTSNHLHVRAVVFP